MTLAIFVAWGNPRAHKSQVCFSSDASFRSFGGDQRGAWLNRIMSSIYRHGPPAIEEMIDAQGLRMRWDLLTGEQPNDDHFYLAFFQENLRVWAVI